mgnify:CR=1 FL=1
MITIISLVLHTPSKQQQPSNMPVRSTSVSSSDSQSSIETLRPSSTATDLNYQSEMDRARVITEDLQFVNESEAQERNEIFENGPTNLNLQISPTSPATVPEDAPVQSPQSADPAQGIHNSSNYTLDPDTVAQNISNIRRNVEQNNPRRQSSRPAPYSFATNIRNGHVAWRRTLRDRANMPGSGVFDTTARHRVHCQECGRGYVRVSISTTITTTSTWINPYPQE